MKRSDTVDALRDRLSAVIERSGLSQSAFADKVGINRSTLSQVLSPANDRLPRVETLTAVATSEQVSIDWLVGLSSEGALRTDIIRQDVHFEPGGRLPADEQLAAWHSEAVGYKVRYVPTTLPDLLKTEEVLEYEYRRSATVTPEQRVVSSRDGLAYMRRPETDMEVCSPVQLLESLAQGEGIWRDLPVDARKRQLEHMIQLTSDLYPTLRWFLYDGLNRYSVPLTIFGPLRAVIYLGQMYLVFTGRAVIQVLKDHFDNLIRAAVLQPPQVPRILADLLDDI
jgi:transcriptional regulator with XRE-family HTH domain